MDHELHDAGAWVRATRHQPCPICGKPDWCAFKDDIALCMRIESPRPSRGDAGGWLHPLTEQRPRTHVRRMRLVANAPVDFAALAGRFMEAMTPERLLALASQLSVSEDALMATGAGWCQERGAWSWPMHDHHVRVVGIRLRDARTHRKYAVMGSKEGVFLGDCPKHGGPPPVLITEGPTDLCAAIDLGFTAVGRPSCTGGTKALSKMLRGLPVIVVADQDEAGERGARALTTALLPTVQSVRTITPPSPHKDLRAWVQAGAVHDDVQALIDGAAPQTVRVRIVR
jgi:hypothetical protein